ncbi:hypothetical protein F0562_033810 [Nyssa sinensis]|uniref:Uncharacterized protein n=1 Tax=Nyssa sinensis TaxID=561372 RepID=A0A5J5AJP4_9ASTE|nr:hypothetical protein F0562_033810 [Nyssa sinensis]
MATLSSSSSSAFLSPVKSKRLSCHRTKATLHFKRPLSVKSLFSPESDGPPPAVQTFWQWLSDEGVISTKSPVKPGIVREGLGLVALRNISRNEVVLEIPKRFWVNPDTVSASEIGNSSTDSTIYWSEEDFSEIQGTQLLSTTLSVKDYVQSEFQKVEEEVILPHKQLFPFPITLDDFLWAFGILRSRAFSRLRGQNLVLIPVADLINHSPRHNNGRLCLGD